MPLAEHARADATAEALREAVGRLLNEKKVDVVIGYEPGPVPGTTAPVFVSSAEEAQRLILDPFCTLNLATYARDLQFQHRQAQKRAKPEERTKKVVGLVARGCTSRSVALHLQERQYERDEVVVIGVPCSGFVDRSRVERRSGGEEIRSIAVEGDEVRFATRAGEQTVPLGEVLADGCRTCRSPAPVFSDLTVGETPAPRPYEGEYDAVAAHEALGADERWAFFEAEMAKCMRCYACRNACPSCYCTTCFVEQSQPQWNGTSIEASETQVFQLMRLYHATGRCVDCGACMAACPNGVDLRRFTKKLEKDALDLFGYRAAQCLDGKPVLSHHAEDDDMSFIFEPE